MKKIAAIVLGVIFIAASASFAFELKINRDPFMDLIKFRELKQRKILQVQSKNSSFLKKEAEFLKSSLTVKMIVVGKSPNSNAALVVGPSGVPTVVVKGYKIRDGVYVGNITNKGVNIDIISGDKKEVVTLKIEK